MKLETYFMSLIGFSVLISAYSRDLTLEPGHLKPFGISKSTQICDEVDEFPQPDVFFGEYVFKKRPIVMRNAAKLSPAFKTWTDDYFLQVNEPNNHLVSIETKKKENRQQEVREMPFTEFVSIYNTSGIYMVNPVPTFIRFVCFYIFKLIMTRKRLIYHVSLPSLQSPLPNISSRPPNSS